MWKGGLEPLHYKFLATPLVLMRLWEIPGEVREFDENWGVAYVYLYLTERRLIWYKINYKKTIINRNLRQLARSSSTNKLTYRPTNTTGHNSSWRR